MSDKPEQPRSRRRKTRGRDAEPLFVKKSEIAYHLEADTKTIDEWIAAGTFPRPHSRPSERFAVWLRRHWKVYIETGSWPEEAYKLGGRST